MTGGTSRRKNLRSHITSLANNSLEAMMLTNGFVGSSGYVAAI